MIRSHLRKAPSAPFRPNTDIGLQHNGSMTREQIASLYDCLDNGVPLDEVSVVVVCVFVVVYTIALYVQYSRNKRSQSETVEPVWSFQQDNPLYVNLEHTSIQVQPSAEEVKMRNISGDNLQGPKQKYEHIRVSCRC